MLSSPLQAERDVGATKLRAVFTPSNKQDWEQRLSKIHPGMSKSDVEKALAGFKPEIGLGGGNAYSFQYRLDYCFVLSVWYENQSNKVISSELSESMKYIWVEPTKDFSGKWVVYYINGHKSHEINYKNGRYNGDFLGYHPNGNLALVQHYQQNRIEGEDLGYFPSGKVSYKGQDKNGEMTGKWV